MANTFTEDNFTVLNKNGKNILFRTDDIGFNELVLSFVNKSQNPITLKGGNKPSALLFNMSFLRDGTFDPVKDFKFGPCEDWEPVLLVNKKWAVWKLVCKNEVVVPPGKSISFVIKNILCKKYDPGYFYISATDIPGYDDVDPSIGKEFVIQDRDITKDRLPMVAAYTDMIYPINQQTGRPCTNWQLESELEISPPHEALPVYLTYDPLAQIKNGFSISLFAEEDIIIKDIKEETRKPAIRIMFLFGTYPYQVTTVNNGNDIEINANQVDWKVKHEADSPFWECIPLPQTIKQNTTISFDVRRLVTQLNAVAGMSLMYIQVNNFGGFADEIYRYQLIKLVAASPVINLKRYSEKIVIGENTKLSWNSMLANRIEITYHTRENQRIVLSTSPKQGEHEIELTQCEPKLLPVPPTAVITSFDVTAYGANGSKAETSVTINVTQRIAEIRSFMVTPPIIEKGVKTKVTLSWEVRDTSQLQLLKKGEQDKDVTRTASKEVELETACEYKLVARSYGDLPNASKTLGLYAYACEPSIALPFYGDKKGGRPQTLKAIDEHKKFLFAQCGQDEVHVISADSNKVVFTFKTKANTFTIHPTKPIFAYYDMPGRGIHFYNFHSGGGSVKAAINPGGNNEPMPMRFSPDGKKLFVSFMIGSTQVECFYHYDDTKDSLQLASPAFNMVSHYSTFIVFSEKNTTVYYSPYGSKHVTYTNYNKPERMLDAFNLGQNLTAILEPGPSSTDSKLYLATENQNLITVLKIGEALTTIDVGAEPFDMILSADEKTMYVACIKANKVLAVNVETRKVEIIHEAIDTPSCLALSKNGELLFVGSHRARTLTVINLKDGTIGTPISTGAQAGNPIVLSVLEDEQRYTVYITKECYAERTKWTAADVITPNTSLNMSVIAIYKPV